LWTDHALLQLEPWIEGFVQACACMCGCVERLLEWNAMDIQKNQPCSFNKQNKPSNAL
jgi:hypothetical protein